MPSVVALFFLCAPLSCVYLDDNFREVEPDAFYRSGQMADHRLGRFVKSHGIRTVVNLRGASPGEAWYDKEREVCAALDVEHFDLDWTMQRLPDPESLARLIEILDAAETPVLVHCHGGTHRAAVASVVRRILNGESVADARGEIGLFFNNAPIGLLLTLYEADGGDFRTWVTDRYPNVYARAQTRD